MPPLTRTLFVDHVPVDSTQDGSLANPYLSIQAAVDAVPTPATVADSVNDWMILIAPGDYDEDIAISGPVRLALIGLGAFRLGLYTVAEPPEPPQRPQTNIVPEVGSTRRNVVWTYNEDQVIPGGAAPQLVIGTIGGTDVIRHGKPIANRISGSIIVQGTAVGLARGGTAFLAIANTQVDAGNIRKEDIRRPIGPIEGFRLDAGGPPPPQTVAIDTTGPLGDFPLDASLPPRPPQIAIDTTGSIAGFDPFRGALVDRHFNSRFRGAILGPLNGEPETAPAYVLVTSFMSQYEGLVQVSRYGSIQQAAFAAGMTVSQVPDLFKSGVPPGMVNCTFDGTFTGPAESLLLDAATNTWFIRNGATLAGGATKSFLGGASQTLAIQAAKTLKDSDCGVTLLANTTPSAFTVTLPSAVGKDDLTFTIKNVGTNSVTVKPAAIVQKIDGKDSLDLDPPATQGKASGIKIVANNGRWWIVAQG